jgi:hypothetical protein
VFFTAIGDTPERVMLSTISLEGDWSTWRASAPVDVIQPERGYECTNLPNAPSESGDIAIPVAQIRDPFVFEEAGRSYLFYSICGEQGIAAAEITGSPPADASPVRDGTLRARDHHRSAVDPRLLLAPRLMPLRGSSGVVVRRTGGYPVEIAGTRAVGQILLLSLSIRAFPFDVSARRRMMKFMVQMNVKKGPYQMQGWSQEDVKRMVGFMNKTNAELKAAGQWVVGEGLVSPEEARLVTASEDGSPSVTDGPFAESKEFIAGFWIIEVKDAAEAYRNRGPHLALSRSRRQAAALCRSKCGRRTRHRCESDLACDRRAVRSRGVALPCRSLRAVSRTLHAWRIHRHRPDDRTARRRLEHMTSSWPTIADRLSARSAFSRERMARVTFEAWRSWRSSQGSGIATELLAAAETGLRDQGCTRVTLDTTRPLDRAIAFYARHGYTPTGVIGDFYGMELIEYEKMLGR